MFVKYFLKILLLNINSLKHFLVFINGKSSNQRSSLEKAFIYDAPVTLNPCPPLPTLGLYQIQ